MPDDNLPLSSEDIARENEALRAELAAATAGREAERAAREAETRRADGLYNRVATSDRQLAGAQVSSLAAHEAQADSAIAAIASEEAGLEAEQERFLA